MPELTYQTIDTDKESKKYWLFRYLCKKHHKEIEGLIVHTHEYIVNPEIYKIIGWGSTNKKEE